VPRIPSHVDGAPADSMSGSAWGRVRGSWTTAVDEGHRKAQLICRRVLCDLVAGTCRSLLLLAAERLPEGTLRPSIPFICTYSLTQESSPASPKTTDGTTSYPEPTTHRPPCASSPPFPPLAFDPYSSHRIPPPACPSRTRAFSFGPRWNTIATTDAPPA
jgi:hypothetical protein